MKSLRLLPLTILFFVLFTEPVISIVNRPVMVAGIPLLYIYVTCIWLLMIGSVSWVLRRNRQNDDSMNSDV
ncbi:hypothetical protein [Arsenicibacter rosenii]|uniref:DUF3311 domain-containing protein n=1 Tax=Arsenicibacter rosenii TaxID=1750698 RepID=A0A1S2VDK5_9BACT|nr:hypothetical protein [Arsenicibacter rosenii]OIN56857.1 hypothetical protein BLX24_23075 [Arsenicibacter rosenii]